MEKEKLWQAILAEVQLNISQANFNTWFKNTKLLSYKDEDLKIAVPNSFTKEWLKAKHTKTIKEAVENLGEEVKDIKYIIKKEKKKEKEIKKEKGGNENQMEFEKFAVDKESNLNPKYTFENFVVGPFNELSQAAAYAVAENPGTVYNPLFIYGKVGLGKTHLLQSIGNKVKSEKKVKYIPAQKFITGVVNGIRNGKMEEFKAKYKDVDVLIIDDIQFLSGKEKTQEEFFHTFNDLYEKNKQIILSSDRPPKSIKALTERLRSRFEGGMIADINFPDLETRLAILKNKAHEKKLNISDEVCEYIAENIKKNIRELEGALNKLVAHNKLTGRKITIDETKKVLKNILKSPTKNVSPNQIIKAITKYYEISESDLKSSSRKKEIVKPRQVAMYLLREELEYSFPFIGKKMGGKDHTTVMYSHKKIKKKLENGDDIKEEISLIKQMMMST